MGVLFELIVIGNSLHHGMYHLNCLSPPLLPPPPCHPLCDPPPPWLLRRIRLILGASPLTGHFYFLRMWKMMYRIQFSG